MHIQLSGCLRQIQIILKESTDDRQCLSVDGIQWFISENFLDEHFTDGNRKLVEQSSNTESAISEDIAFGIENFTNLKSGACFFVCIGKIFQVICRVAVSNPGLCHGFCAQHIYKHMCNIFQIVICFCRCQFTDDDNATIIDRSDEIMRACRKYIFDGSQCVFILGLTGFNEKDSSPCTGRNMKFACPVKGFYICIISKEQFLHKGIFVIFFGITFQDTLNLADSQFANRGNRIFASPHNEKKLFIFFCYFVETAGGIWQTKSSAVSEFFQFGFCWKAAVTGGDQNGIIFLKKTEIEMTDAFPVIHIFL